MRTLATTRRQLGGARDWELTGGILVCGECGGRMSTDQSGGGKYFYYNCSAARTRDGSRAACEGVGSHRAEPLERAVVEAVDGELLCDPAKLEAHMDATIQREQATFGAEHRAGAAKTLAGRMEKLESRRGAYEEMRADGGMTKERFREKVAALHLVHDSFLPVLAARLGPASYKPYSFFLIRLPGACLLLL